MRADDFLDADGPAIGAGALSRVASPLREADMPAAAAFTPAEAAENRARETSPQARAQLEAAIAAAPHPVARAALAETLRRDFGGAPGAKRSADVFLDEPDAPSAGTMPVFELGVAPAAPSTVAQPDAPPARHPADEPARMTMTRGGQPVLENHVAELRTEPPGPTIDMPGSVFHGRPKPQPQTPRIEDVGGPASEAFVTETRRALEAMTPEQRQQVAARQDMRGSIARRILEGWQRQDEAGARVPAVRALTGRVEDRAQRLASGGYDPALAGGRAMAEAKLGIPDQADSTVRQSLLDFDAERSIPKRVWNDFSSGVVGSTGAALAYGGRKAGIDAVESLGDAMTHWSESKLPAEPTFADQLVNGVGSMGSFFVPGLGVMKGANALAVLSPALAKWAGAGVMSALEAAAEADAVFKDATRQGASQDEATARAEGAFWSNMALLGVTNKLGFFNDVKRLGGRIAAGAVTEGPMQEGPQQVIQNYFTGRPLEQGVPEAVAIGSIVGGGAAGVHGALSPRTEAQGGATPAIPAPIIEAFVADKPATRALITSPIVQAEEGSPYAQPQGAVQGQVTAQGPALAPSGASGASQEPQLAPRAEQVPDSVDGATAGQELAPLAPLAPAAEPAADVGLSDDTASPLQALSDIAVQQAGEVGPGGVLTQGMVSPEDWKILSDAGLVTEHTAEGGATYQGVSGYDLGAERDRRNALKRERAKAGVSPEEKARAIERRAAMFDRVAQEKTEAGFPEDAAPLLEKAKELREQARKVRAGEPAGDGTRAAPVVITTPQDIDRAASVASTEPTDGQKDAGNYQHGHLRFQGFDIAIENPRGSERTGTAPDGTPWSVTMPANYGYVKRTEGADGDQVDVYLGSKVDAPQVFIVDQIDPETGAFDEHKAMLGMPSIYAARQTYEAGFSDGKGKARMGAITTMPVEQFREWLKTGDTTKPLRYQPKAGKRTVQDGKVIVSAPTVAEPDWWKNSTGAERYDKMRAAGIKGTGSTPWNRLTPEQQQAMNQQWGPAAPELPVSPPQSEAEKDVTPEQPTPSTEGGKLNTSAAEVADASKDDAQLQAKRFIGRVVAQGKKLSEFRGSGQMGHWKIRVDPAVNRITATQGGTVHEFRLKAIADIVRAENAKAKPKPERATRPIPLDDERLKDETVRAHLEFVVREAGWDEQGGRLLVDEVNRDRQPGTGEVLGKTVWAGQDWWQGRPENARIPGDTSGAMSREAVRKALAGEPLKAVERRAVQHMLDVAQHRAELERQDLEAAGVDALPQDEQDAVLDLADDIVTTVRDGDWQSMSEAEKDAELDAIFGPGPAQSQGGEAIAGGEEGRTEAREDQTGPPSEERPPLDLTGQTPADLAAQAQRESAEALKAAADRLKETADALRDQFTLTGSNRVADEAAARGQQDLLAEPADEAAAEQPEPTRPAPEQPATPPAEPAAEDAGSVSADDFERLISEVQEERSANKPSTPKRPRAPRKTASAARTKRPSKALKEAGQHAAEGVKEGFAGLDALFGRKGTLGSGPAFDEETWAKAKPHFEAAFQEFVEAGRSLKEFIRHILDTYNDRIVPYLRRWHQDKMREAQEEQNADADSRTAAEPDSPARTDEVGPEDLGDESGAIGDGRGPAVQGGEGEGRGAGGQRVRDGNAVAPGEPGDQPVSGQDTTPGSPVGPAGSHDPQRGGDASLDGVQPDQPGAESARQAAARPASFVERIEAQKRAESIPVKTGDIDNIRATLPVLLEGQQDDVRFAEERFAKPEGQGVLFTNGTGTGKTLSGLGIVKRFARQGKSNILIVAPSDKIASDWITSAKWLGLDLSMLPDTRSAGKGIVVTTYANFGANESLFSRDWDLVITDESHYLMNNKEGTPSAALDQLRLLTRHESSRWRYPRAKHPKEWERFETANASAAALRRDQGSDDRVLRAAEAEADAAHKAWTPLEEAARAEFDAIARADKPRVAFLSATPFAYHFNVDYAEGYLFDFDRIEGRGYNQPGGRDAFYIQHFGYRMRTGKLTKPDANVDQGLMEVQFNAWLKQQGALSSRMLDVEADYDRRFIMVDDAIGMKIDDGMKFLREAHDGIFSPLHSHMAENFTYHNRMYLLEALKARHAVSMVREHLNAGRKVVVFHDFLKGGGFHPFRFPKRGDNLEMSISTYKDGKHETQTVKWNDLVDRFNLERSDLVELNFDGIGAPINVLRNEFPEALFFNGTIPKQKRREAVAKFNADDGKHNLIVVQSDAGREGISLHDTTGKFQRALVNLGMPVRPTSAIQIEGRIYRTGQVSNAMFRYLNTGTNYERWTFASKIAERAGTAENLAMGDDARALKETFIEAFEDSGAEPTDGAAGTGGKARDRMRTQAITPFQRAKSFYFGNQKRNSRTKSAEGTDYFATPEPLGFKMVEWANIRKGERALEPSAGHGAIGRWLPQGDMTLIEPSYELVGRAKLVAPDAKLLNVRFEDHDIVNKYDAIVMNPPFGVGGKTAIEHLAKAARHLRDGGRIVALLPEGTAADKRLEQFLYGTETRKVRPAGQWDGKDVYRGDVIRAQLPRYNGTVTRGTAGGVFVKIANQTGETFLPFSMFQSVDSKGARTEEVSLSEGLHLVADIGLPDVTFERAGTNVKTHVVVLEKQTDPARAARITQRSRRDVDAKDINEFFDAIEGVGVPDRIATTEASPAAAQPQQTAQAPAAATAGESQDAGQKYVTDAPEIEYVTRKGKTLKGVIAKDLSEAQAKAIDPYTWKKDGGYFIRSAHVQRPGETPAFSRADDTRFAANVLTELAATDEVFRYPVSQSADLETVFSEIAPEIEFRGNDTRPDEERESGAERRFMFHSTTTNKDFWVYERGRDVWIDVSHLEVGDAGSKIYAAVLSYTHNARKRLIGDPKGLSTDAVLRRTSAMLSSALRFGTTRHMFPATEQRKGGIQGTGIAKLEWGGADFENLQNLIDAHLSTIYARVPELRGIRYDFGKQRFVDENGDRVGREWFVETAKEPSARGIRAGEATLRRGALLQSLVSSEAGARPGILQAVLTRAVQLAREGDLGATFRRSGEFTDTKSPASAGLSASDVRERIGQITAKWANAPEVVVVESMDDPDVPKRVREHDAKQRSQGATGSPEGFWYDGKAYIVLDGITTTDDAVRVLFHETLGHYGLRGVFGPRLNPLLDQLARARKDDVAAKAKQYGLDVDNEADRRTAAEEVLADLAQTRPELGWVKRLVAAIRNFLRDAGLPIRMSDADIIQRYITPARGFVERGKGSARGEVAFHRAFHGSPHDFDEFTLQKIGTGEGNQAYGWGLYFASNRDVAEWYKRNLSEANYFIDGKRIAEDNPTHIAAAMLVEHNGDRAAAAQALRAEAITSYAMDARPIWIAAAEVLESDAKLPVAEKRQGRLYQVDLAPAEDEYIDWNKMLSEQSPKVQAALGSAQSVLTLVREHGDGRLDGRGIYKALSANATVARDHGTKAFADVAQHGRTGEEAASRYLLSLGILGIKYLDGSSRGKGEGHHNYVIFDDSLVKVEAKFSRGKPSGDPILDEARRRAGITRDERNVVERALDYLRGGKPQITADLGETLDESTQGALDRFYGIKRAEQQLGNLPAEQSGYVAARLSTGIPSLMRGILQYGAPEWRDGIISRKADSKGLLDVLAPVRNDFDDWIGWMVGKRAQRLAAEGRENNLEPDHIKALIARGKGKEERFQTVAREFAAFKRAILDTAEGAGLIDATTRPMWDQADWIPFYRVADERVRGPGNRRGLSGQSSGIRTLRGGQAAINDPLENILMNFSHLLDASLKNHAIRQVAKNLGGTGVLEKVGMQTGASLVPLNQIPKILEEQGVAAQIVAQIPKASLQGIQKMWSIQAPTDRDVVRVMVNGKAEYYRVKDPLLLRSLTAVHEQALGGVMTPLRWFKRLLTHAVTATPDFMARNFIRDALHAWAINKDGFSPGIDSVRGAVKSITEKGGMIDMMFAGGSFLGGYVNGNDPKAMAAATRAALREKGWQTASINSFMASIIDTPAKFWETWQRLGGAIENANREAVYEAAIKAGKSRAEAVYEAKDLMDYSMQGDWVLCRVLADTIAFFNARLQGSYKLYRAGRYDFKTVAIRGLVLTAASLALLGLNWDRPEYDELDEWDKDTYWHFWIMGEHFRIPKPFEIGVIFGTIPERMARALGGQDSYKLFLKRLWWNFSQNAMIVEQPQFVRPLIELWGNRSAFTGRPIEGMADEGKLPEARYNETTSDTMKSVAALMPEASNATGLSPKRLEHLWRGYLGELGMYALGLSDIAVRALQDAPPQPSMRMDSVPLIKAFYRESPPRSTKFVTEFYDMYNEVEGIHRTIAAYDKQGLGDRAEALENKQSTKLDERKALSRSARELSAIRKDIEEVYRDRNMSRAEKRKRIDGLTTERNAIAKEAVEDAEPAFQ